MDTLIWLGVAALMAVIGIVSLTLITVWFVIGGLAAFVAALLGADIGIQTALFIIVSVASLVLFRPLALKHRNIGEKLESTPVGSYAVVIEDIENDALTGRVETPDHMTWAAVSSDGSHIFSGEKVLVTGNKSIKLVVERI